MRKYCKYLLWNNKKDFNIIKIKKYFRKYDFLFPELDMNLQKLLKIY